MIYISFLLLPIGEGRFPFAEANGKCAGLPQSAPRLNSAL
jgi:hypothetical protein